MPNDTFKRDRDRYGRTSGYRGKYAGQDSKFAGDDDEESAWQAYKAKRKLPFTAQRKDYPDYAASRKPKPAPSPSPSPTPSTEDAAKALMREEPSEAYGKKKKKPGDNDGDE